MTAETTAAKSARLTARHDQETERLRRERDALQEDLEGAERALRQERRRVKALQTELDGTRRANRNFKIAEQVFEYWRTHTGHERSEFLDARQKALLWALKHYTPRECCLAILGCCVDGYVNPRTGQRYDDLPQILGDEVRADRNIARWEAYCRTHGRRFERGPALKGEQPRG